MVELQEIIVKYPTTPRYTIEELLRYQIDRIPPGSFLYAVLSNNLKESFGRADIHNRAALFEIVSFVYNEMPLTCQDSEEKVEAWLNAR